MFLRPWNRYGITPWHYSMIFKPSVNSHNNRLSIFVQFMMRAAMSIIVYSLCLSYIVIRTFN